METNSSQLSYHWIKEEIKKEVKDFLEFSQNESTECQHLWDRMKAVLMRKVHSTKCLHKEFGEISHKHLNSIPESSRTKRSKHTQEE